MPPIVSWKGWFHDEAAVDCLESEHGPSRRSGEPRRCQRAAGSGRLYGASGHVVVLPAERLGQPPREELGRGQDALGDLGGSRLKPERMILFRAMTDVVERRDSPRGSDGFRSFLFLARMLIFSSWRKSQFVTCGRQWPFAFDLSTMQRFIAGGRCPRSRAVDPPASGVEGHGEGTRAGPPIQKPRLLLAPEVGGFLLEALGESVVVPDLAGPARPAELRV